MDQLLYWTGGRPGRRPGGRWKKVINGYHG